MESFSKDAKALRDLKQTNALHEYYNAKLGGGDDVVTGKLLGLERSPDFAHIFEDIKRSGAQAAMANYNNEPLMLKLSRAMGGIPEEVKPSLEKIHKSPVTIQEACKMGDKKISGRLFEGTRKGHRSEGCQRCFLPWLCH